MKFAYLIEPPFNYVDSAGRITGCDVELARHVFSQLGLEPFEPVETEFAELLPGLADGGWRMTTGLFSTEERRRLACFSRPIWALSDGLLVQRGNPLQLSGYTSIANSAARLAIIRDQFQHRSAVEFGVPDQRIEIFETYTEAARAVQDGRVDAYASVGRAHTGFMEQHPDWKAGLVAIPEAEKPPAFGSLAFALDDIELRQDVDEVLSVYLGSKEHRRMAARFGYSDAEVDLVVDTNS
jgi:polar amino acid transport system substrate-binding protein